MDGAGSLQPAQVTWSLTRIRISTNGNLHTNSRGSDAHTFMDVARLGLPNHVAKMRNHATLDLGHSHGRARGHGQGHERGRHLDEVAEGEGGHFPGVGTRVLSSIKQGLENAVLGNECCLRCQWSLNNLAVLEAALIPFHTLPPAQSQVLLQHDPELG